MPTHESNRLLWLDHLAQDLRQGARALTRYPIAASVAVISLAFGIGATTATLTIRDVVFRKPPPLYREPAQLSRLQMGSPTHPLDPMSGVAGALFTQWRETPIDADLAAATQTRVREYRTEDQSDTMRVRAATANFFSVLGVQAAVGSADLTSNAVVLSARVWRTRFDRRADIVGQPLWIDNKPLVVAGVLPERFWFASTDSAVWILLEDDALSVENTLDAVARRRPGVTPEMLAAQLQGGLAAYAAGLPAGERQIRLAVPGIEGTPVGRNVSLALPWLLAAAVLLTLLIACANVAILVIAQWTAREHEIAIRASLGASRGRVVRGLLAESMIIAVLGGALGICVALGLSGIIAHRAGAAVQFFDLSIEPHVLIDSILITMFTGVICGIGPALVETRRLQANPMRTLATSEGARQLWRHALVVMEIAITVALLVVTSVMLNAYQRELSHNVGFRTHPLVALRVENSRGVPAPAILDAIARMPGVAAVTAASSIPYMGSGPLEAVSIDAAGTGTVRAEHISISSSFFATLDVPVRAGRAFTSSDTPMSHTAIVNESLATHLFRTGNPVGRQIWLDGTSYEIVGIVAQYMNAAMQTNDWKPKIYLPLTAPTPSVRQLTFMIRATSDPIPVARALRTEVRNAAAGNEVANLFTLDEVIAIAGEETLVGTAPLLPLIATGMLLTTAGIYGVLAFAVARRSKELAVRVAIGARSSDLVRLVTLHSVRLIATGTMIGVGTTFALSRIVRASGGGGSFLDPSWPAFVVPVAVILIIGFVATLVPSRRAVKVDPAVLLRTI
jgi:putative ABC transport system permease protein